MLLADHASSGKHISLVSSFRFEAVQSKVKSNPNTIMKVQTLKSLLTGILCTTGVLATIETIYNNDGSIHAIQSFPDGGSHLNKRGCTSNNCLRAMVARPDAATSFCNAFTTAVSSGVAPFTQCVGAAKASSACSCLVPVSLSASSSRRLLC